jgi:hypothetical protein
MTSLDALDQLKDRFDPLVKSVDLAILMEHVRRLEPAAFARHFKGFRPQTLGRKRITDALRFEVYERRNSSIGDVLTLLWNQEHRDVYHAMLEHVKTIQEDVESIERIEDAKANEFLDDLVVRFPVEDILVCVRLNDVRFGPEVIATRLEGRPPAPPEETPSQPS